jgi:DNA-binding PadR family transcriptional regulator
MESLEPLTPAVFHILLALSDEERHGYGIIKDVLARTNGQLRLGAGTLYGCIKRMLEAGLIAEAGERPDPAHDDERRKYYRLTAIGRRATENEARRLEQLVRDARDRQVLPRLEVRT